MGGLFSFLKRPEEEALLAPAGIIDFEGRDGILYAKGPTGEEVPFQIKGCNWFGSEAYNGPPNGLAEHGIEWYLDFMQKHKFNALRLLFNHEHIFKDDIVETPQSERLLFQKRYIHMFGILAREAAKRGILVLIACHRIKASAWPGKGLWYDNALGFSEDRVKQSWSLVAKELCQHWNVLGADLQNEPHSSSWGKGLSTDWNHAAERIGNHVSSLCPRWLIFVEGVGYTPGAPNGDDPGAGIWWGENLIGTRVAPVRLQKQEKLVYTPHVYGPSVYLQNYFKSPFFPNNMPDVWEQHFAFAKEMTGRPIVIGEMGGSYDGLDKQWQDWAIPYAASKGFGIFYFALNPDSKDTTGLVDDDWNEGAPGSVQVEKLAALAQLPSTDVFELCPQCMPADSRQSVTPPLPPPPPPPIQKSSPSIVSSPPPTLLSPKESPPIAKPRLSSPPPPRPTLSMARPPAPVPVPFHSAMQGQTPQPQMHSELGVPQLRAAPTPSTAGGGSSNTFAYVWCLMASVAIALLLVRKRRLEREARADEHAHEPLKLAMEPSVPLHKKAAASVLPTKASKARGARRDGKHSAAQSDSAPEEPVMMMLLPDDGNSPQAPQEPSLGAAPQGRTSNRLADAGETFDRALKRANGRVRVKDLRSEPQYNGEDGIVMGHTTTADGTRWNVRCLNGVRLSLKAQNLEVVLPEEGGRSI